MASDVLEFSKELIKLATMPRYAFWIFLTTLLLLVCPLPTFLNLAKIREPIDPYLGLLCLCSLLLWVVEFLAIAINQLQLIASKKHAEHKILHYLKSLNKGEASILVDAYQKNVQTIIRQKDAEEVHSLLAKGLLLEVKGESNFNSRQYTIPTFVWNHLLKPEVVPRIRSQMK